MVEAVQDASLPTERLELRVAAAHDIRHAHANAAPLPQLLSLWTLGRDRVHREQHGRSRTPDLDGDGASVVKYRLGHSYSFPHPWFRKLIDMEPSTGRSIVAWVVSLSGL